MPVPREIVNLVYCSTLCHHQQHRLEILLYFMPILMQFGTALCFRRHHRIVRFVKHVMEYRVGQQSYSNTRPYTCKDGDRSRAKNCYPVAIFVFSNNNKLLHIITSSKYLWLCHFGSQRSNSNHILAARYSYSYYRSAAILFSKNSHFCIPLLNWPIPYYPTKLQVNSFSFGRVWAVFVIFILSLGRHLVFPEFRIFAFRYVYWPIFQLSTNLRVDIF